MVEKIKRLNTKYRVKKKRINLVIEELKQRLIAKKTQVKRHKQRISQIWQKLTISSQPETDVRFECSKI